MDLPLFTNILSSLPAACGWVGGFTYLLAYGLVTYRYVSGRSCVYHILNISAAGLCILNFATYGAWAAVTVNGIFAVIGGITLIRYFLSAENKS